MGGRGEVLYSEILLEVIEDEMGIVFCSFAKFSYGLIHFVLWQPCNDFSFVSKDCATNVLLEPFRPSHEYRASPPRG